VTANMGMNVSIITHHYALVQSTKKDVSMKRANFGT
jgi:hypothetical protein